MKFNRVDINYINGMEQLNSQRLSLFLARQITVMCIITKPQFLNLK